MEFVSGYRDEFLDFAALLFGWFRKFVAERGAVGTSLEGRWRQLEAQIRRLPQDPALWVLHVLPNRSVGISLGQGAEPGPGPGLGAARLLGDEPPLHLRDLSPYVSFVSLEEGEEGEEEEEEEEENGEEEGAGTKKVETEEDGEPAPGSREPPREATPPGEPEEAKQEAGGGEDGKEDRAEDGPGPERRTGRRGDAAPLHLSCLLLVTDEHGIILGIDLLMEGAQGSTGRGSGAENLAPRAYALLCHSMVCPMGSGDPRKPRQLTVGDAQLHWELENLVPRLGVKLAKTPMRTWGPRPGFTFASLRARTCHVCHRHSFEVKLTPCPQCGAVLYCGEACLRADWKRCPDDVSHRFWCPRLAAFMERAGELATLPFTYTAGDPYQPLQGDGPALMPPVPPDSPRGLFVPELNIQNKQSLKIHVVEAGKEFDLVMVFWVSLSRPEGWASGCGGEHRVGPRFVLSALQELLVLLPHVALELQFVGDGLPPESDQQHFTLQRDGPEVSVRPGSGVSARLSSGTKEKGGRRDLQIKVSARPYHLLQGPKPDLVIVPPSAGLLHREQRVWLCDGRPDHGGGHRRGDQPSTAQPFPLPLSPQSGRQLHALVRPSYSLAAHPEKPTSTLVSMVLGPSWPSPTLCFLRPHSSLPPLEGLDNAHTPLYRTSSQNLSNPWSSTQQNIALITPWLAHGALSLPAPPGNVEFITPAPWNSLASWPRP
ncbi:zinc finger MYND domain-containing protein 15 isoform X10 [Bubalus bubalis]|uniref:zinc finger MYND domain-containing protein 15 isoform X10 n=1 Tax=Bubalus bubalis TaxID=89462 RepID=UPI001E1B8366|nr:zinc finger MYND domain-containing protein 15 isoform X10 [Bubalus bubalis]